jgi:anthranilate synthase component 1
MNLQYEHKQLEQEFCPILAYEKLYSEKPYSFLYESLESLGKRGRYSFIGGRPFQIFQSKGDTIAIQLNGNTQTKKGNPIQYLRELLCQYQNYPSVMPFCGGAVGYMAYDMIPFFEKVLHDNPDELDTPDSFFMFPSEVIVFDHKEKTVDIIVYSTQGNDVERLTYLQKIIETCIGDIQNPKLQEKSQHLNFESNFSEKHFNQIVDQAKEYIYAGDIFQVVLSQRFQFELKTDSFTVYKALRLTNPSPYMYYLNLNDIFILGSSPEILVKLLKDKVITRPLAGTRPRGHNPKEDQNHEMELLKDEKERAEHIMLVDLARNDIGRICQYGTIQVTNLLEIERYSKVMHIVSNVIGKLKHPYDAFDVLSTSFPAGTVSGAPKVRAMEIINELETIKRNIYAGSIGYFDFNGNMDMCIAIRNIIMKKNQGFIQAGAGIVADSVPKKEYQETINKARALVHAVEMVGG